MSLNVTAIPVCACVCRARGFGNSPVRVRDGQCQCLRARVGNLIALQVAPINGQRVKPENIGP